MGEPGSWRRIADLLREAADGEQVGPAVAEVAGRTLGVDHASMTLVVAGDPVSTVGSSDAAVMMSHRQFTLGEGPAVRAVATGAPALVDDLATPESIGRAPLFVPEALDEGVRAMFAFPLRVGGAIIGVMTGHRATRGSLTAAQYADGLIVSSLATLALLQMEAGPSLGRVAVSFEPSNGLHALTQIASGMVSEQLGVPIVEALVRIRARAFVDDQPVEEVARRIVARELRLER